MSLPPAKRRPLLALRLARVLLTHGLLGACGLAVAFPFLWMVLTSLKTDREALSYPPVPFPRLPQWTNYAEAWAAAPFARYFFNTGLIAAAVTLSVVATALLAGYAFGQLEFPGKRPLFGL